MGGFSARARLLVLGFFFHLHKQNISCRPFPLASSKRRMFLVLSVVCSQPLAGGGCQTAGFFLCVGWGGLFNVSILEESLRVGWYNLPPDVPHAEVELCSLLKQIEPGKEKIIV